MAAPPITLQITKFEQIEILRAEIEAREEELHKTEVHIREILFDVERLKFLQTIHAIYTRQQQPAEAANLAQLHAQRDALREAVQAMQATLAALEKETAGQAAPPSRGPVAARSGAAPGVPPGSRRRFDSFDDFRSQQGR
jgi:hypothetical protein